MGHARIASDLLLSIPESASSLDVVRGVYPTSVEASISDYGGDSPFLRVAATRKQEVELSEEDVQKKINEWKKHTKENATSAGFRKATHGRGTMDPRKFAFQLSEVARLNANRYRSHPLARLAKKLRWVAAQDRQVAEQALNKMAGPAQQGESGMPVIQKPPVNPISPIKDPEEDTELAPGVPVQYNRDQSWSSQESGRMGRRRAKEDEYGLVTLARDFLQEYKSVNSLYDDEDLLDKLEDPTVFESWLLDLDSKGRNPDPDQLDEAWQQAINELSEGIGGEDHGEDLHPLAASRSRETIQDQTAPGGDWANTVIQMEENPVMDRYLRHMADKRSGRSLQARKESLDEDIAEAVDQTLDNFAGEMVPSEISPEHVQQFIEDNFPGVPWKKVYEMIQKIADPKKRHDEDPKERTNQEASRKRTTVVRPRIQLSHGSTFDPFFEGRHSVNDRSGGQQKVPKCGRRGCGGDCGCSRHSSTDPGERGVRSKKKPVKASTIDVSKIFSR